MSLYKNLDEDEMGKFSQLPWWLHVEKLSSENKKMEREGIRNEPEHVEDLSVRVNSYKNIRHGHKLKVCIFGIREVDLRLPDGFD